MDNRLTRTQYCSRSARRWGAAMIRITCLIFTILMTTPAAFAVAGGNGGGGTSPASRKHNHHKELLHDRWAPMEENHLAAVLEQIRVQRKPSILKEVECSKRWPSSATDNPLASNTCN